MIPNAYWDKTQNMCLCDPGFTVNGYSCICKGIPFDHYCDRCAFRPHSEFYYGICQCKKGYTLYGNECLPDLDDGDDNPTQCSVGTYFNTQQKKCLTCPDGCLSCSDSYTCLSCSVHFEYDWQSKLCFEICGDGFRYTLECDDGNNADGDGCSRSCQIEPSYTCRGGSPSTPDNCLVYNPSFVTLTQIGQIRYATKIISNIKVDYLPQ